MKRLLLFIFIAGLIGFGMAVRGTVSQVIEDYNTGHWTLAKIAAGEDVTVTVFTDSLLKTNKPLYCAVKAGGQDVVPITRFATVGMDEDVSADDFIVLRSDEANVIGLVFKSAPSQVLFLGNLSNRETWTQDAGEADSTARGLRLLGTLEQATGKSDLSLTEQDRNQE